MDIAEVIEQVDYENASSSGDVFAGMPDDEFMQYTEQVGMVVDREVQVATMVPDTSAGIASASEAIEEPDGSEDLQTFLAQVQDVREDGLSFMREVAKCPNCGKVKRLWTPMAWCSTKCALKDIAKMAIGSFELKQEKSKEREQRIDKIIDTINDITNIVTAVPQIVLHADSLIEEYKKYAYVKVAIMAKKLQKVINSVLIWKNELIIDMLKDAKNGVVNDLVRTLISAIDAILVGIEKMCETFQKLYSAAMKSINVGSVMWKIAGESMGFFFTVRSILPTHKAGQFNVAFSMDANAYSSNLHNVIESGLSDMINAAFPPLTNEEWFLAPTAFKVRALLSDQNGKAIKKILNVMDFIMCPGGCYLPKYKYLTLINPWFDIATLKD